MLVRTLFCVSLDNHSISIPRNLLLKQNNGVIQVSFSHPTLAFWVLDIATKRYRNTTLCLYAMIWIKRMRDRYPSYSTIIRKTFFDLAIRNGKVGDRTRPRIWEGSPSGMFLSNLPVCSNTIL